MPIQVDATFRNAQDITLDAFRAPDGSPREYRDMTIEVGGRAFCVSFADPNSPSVRFAEYNLINGIIRGSQRTAVLNRLKDLVARHSLAKDLGKVTYVTGYRENAQRAFRTEKNAIAKSANGKFALYGFSAIRDPSVRRFGLMACEESRKTGAPMSAQAINYYNESIGLCGEDESAALTIAFVRDNDRNRWPYDPVDAERNHISRKDQTDWAKFLRWHDVDLFSKIRKARSDAEMGKRTGWAGEIARRGLTAAVNDMIRKNIDPRIIREFPDVNLMAGSLTDVILEIVDTDFGELDRAGIEAKIDEIISRHAPQEKAADVRRVLNHVSMTAFWRQTSKLGLDFFKSRGETVIFAWTTFDGKKTDGAELGDKWWKDGETDVADHFGAAITNSEMRHLSTAKYASVIGSGRVVRVEGAMSPETAERIVAEQIAQFDSFDPETLDLVIDNLEAGFAETDEETFINLAIDVLTNLPLDVKDDYIDLNNEIANPRLLRRLCARALDAVQERIDNAPSSVVKAAILASVGDVFQAEILKDPEIDDKWDNSRRTAIAEIPPGVPSPLVLRQLAGVERNLGSKAFFSPRTGKLNELGQCLFNAGGDVMTNVSRLRRAFAEEFGISEEDALSHPAFQSFIPRVARAAGGDLDNVIESLPAVRMAHEAKEAVMAHIRDRIPILPEAQRIFKRRGEWDLNRLIYNEAVEAQQRGRPVDLDRLRRNGEVICDLCVRTESFVREFARRINPNDEPGLRLTEAEAVRLSDAYLDREGSAVNAYRLTGDEDYVQKFDTEAEAALFQSMRLLLELQDRAFTYRRNAQGLRNLYANFRRRFRLKMPLVHRAPPKRPEEGEAPEQDLKAAAAERTRKEAERVRQVERRAAELEVRGNLLTDERLKSIVINAVALSGKRFHGVTGLMLYRVMKEGGALPMNVGKTAKERVLNFARALSNLIKDKWMWALREESRMAAIGYDDGDKALQEAFAIYLKETPEVKAFLDREVEESVANEVMAEINEHLDEIPRGDPIRYVVDIVLAHGKL